MASISSHVQAIDNPDRFDAHGGAVLRGKKGAAFTLRAKGKGSWVENLPKLIALSPHWYYCWALHHPECPVDDREMDFLPMVWGLDRQQVREGKEAAPRRDPPMALGFNEPDNKNQSNLSVSKAIDAWPSLEAMNLPLVSPSCVNPLGSWMVEFMRDVDHNGLRVDAIGVHYYGGPDVGGFQRKIQAVHETYRRPVLITEMAVADWEAATVETNRYSPADVFHFIRSALPWMEAQEWIVGYCWFCFGIEDPHGTSSALFAKDGSTLTELGRFYATFASPTVERRVPSSWVHR
jgi:Glycosyl hydrolase catalytic core